MATHGTLYIKSNDGTAYAGALAIYDASGASLITVTATGATSDFSGADAYTYGGNKEFLGFAEVANATEPTYAIGDTFYASGEGTVYIVEAEEPTTSGVTVEYNGSVVATIPNGNTATLPVADKKMKSDIVITVPEAEGGTDSAIPIEVATEAEMTALLESGEVGGVYKYTGTTGTYENGALYVLEEEAEEAESIVGTWVWNDILTEFPSSSFTFGSESGSTIANSTYFATVSQNLSGIRVRNTAAVAYLRIDNVSSTVYDGDWQDASAKTITFYDGASTANNFDAFFPFLLANATKQ